ncbi:MAG TPA: alternative ribosome rescue aminoacyl-tRNA hydrolase ArfB [Candidatus Kapabacteria bacterium]|nr:alternative ribosome rescue aminoacyl-tRNA hydrolase ArfB [Candidatus Kapabacteria bacterium]
MIDSEATVLEIRTDRDQRILIPFEEIRISYTRSGGPGGQHVNKTSTQAELTFDLAHSPSISNADRAWLLERLASKLDSSGILHISSQEFRSQLRNKNAAIEKLQNLLESAIRRPKPRKKIKLSKAAKETRLRSKKIAGEKKKLRAERFSD